MLLIGRKLHKIINSKQAKAYPKLVAIKNKIPSGKRRCRSCFPKDLKVEIYHLLKDNKDLLKFFREFFGHHNLFFYIALNGKKRQLYSAE
jgi:hypothetical protein